MKQTIDDTDDEDDKSESSAYRTIVHKTHEIQVCSRAEEELAEGSIESHVSDDV